MDNTENSRPVAIPPFAALAGSATDELAMLKVENERLRDIVRRCNSDWQALRDWIVATNGPTEACRFWDAAKTHKGVGIFRSYLASLWAELDKCKSPNAEVSEGGPLTDGKH